MIYNFHPDAELELTDAIEYYEDIQKGLGKDFASEVYKSINRIISHPKAWAIIKNSIRRSLINRFPYGIIYNYNEDRNEIFILAVMNLYKKPRYWKSRKGS